MESNRPNPDKLLASIREEEAKGKRGKLKIFLGMCPGVGKTYAMLQAAREAANEGMDVLVGVVETHGRKETEALLEGLAIASKVERPYRGILLHEMDLDAVLAIRPQLAIVDELAHTNVPGSRHPKRYQDVLELLASGIDVYTTLNVQHVESRAEAVAQITGIRIQETIPDSILDEADEITVIDLSPDQLRERLKEGKVYIGERAAVAADNFFREENLTALREMALRLTAERVNQDLREIMTEQRIEGPWKTGERLMVAVGPTPFSESLIRWTRRAATSLNAPWLAVYVETARPLDENEEKRLMRNLSLARQLGAEVIVRSGADVANTLLEAARQNNVSQICIGKPLKESFWERFSGYSLTNRLVSQSGNIDIHMVRVKSLGSEKIKTPRKFIFSFITAQEYGIIFGISTVVTLIGFMVESITGYSSISLLYLLAVVISGLFLGRWAVLFLGALSALLWNFLFIPPRFTFLINKPYDAMMFSMYFVIALVMGHITARLKERERAEVKQQRNVSILYQLTKILALTHDSRKAIQNALGKLEEILKAEGAVFLMDEKGRPNFDTLKCGTLSLAAKEKSVATWVFQKKEPAGRFTETLPDAQNFYLPLVSMDKTLGILALKPSQKQTWSLDERSLIESFGSLMTVILEKELLSRAAEEAKIKAESEKLYSTLLDNVSHELKTPLTVIAGSAEHLNQKGITPDAFRKLVLEIQTASRRLLETINGLLNMTRLGSGHIQLNMDWHDMRDVVNDALEKLREPLSAHEIIVKYPDHLLPVKMDASVIRQVLSNLLSNAAVYAPIHTKITISISVDKQALTVSVSDEGPGIPAEDMNNIFDKFYRGKNARPGGLGLGLSIAKRFVEAHGGEIEAYNQEEKGIRFTFRLPVQFFRSDEKEKTI